MNQHIPRVNPAVFGEGYTDKEATAAAYTPIEDELKRIDSNIQHINALIGELSKRLDYYLVQPQPRPTNEAGVPMASSPMSQALQRINLDLYSISDKLHDIYERVER